MRIDSKFPMKVEKRVLEALGEDKWRVSIETKTHVRVCSGK